jgi:hypothetical protein
VHPERILHRESAIENFARVLECLVALESNAIISKDFDAVSSYESDPFGSESKIVEFPSRMSSVVFMSLSRCPTTSVNRLLIARDRASARIV